MSNYASSLVIRLGIHFDWPKGDTPYYDGGIEDLATIDWNTAIMLDQHHIPFRDPEYNSIPNGAYTRINLGNNKVEWVEWVPDEFGIGHVESVVKTMAPYTGMIVGIWADAEYVIWVGDRWMFLWKFSNPGASEISFDAGFPRPGRTLGMVIIDQECIIPTGQRRSRIIPMVAPHYGFKALDFTLKKNGDPIGTVSIPYAGGPVTSPTFAIVENRLLPGDRLSLVAPDNLMGLNGFALTLRTIGTR